MNECLTAVPHCNGIDYWIILRGYPTQNNGRFYSVLLTSAGLSPNLTPVVSANFTDSYSGQLKGNNDGTQIAEAIFSGSANSTLAVYDFNSTTGVVSNEHLAPASSSNIGLGVTFSPNGDYIYLIENVGQQSAVYQYDAANLSIPRKVLSSQIEAQQFETGPDNTIYLAQTEWNTLYLDVITNPDNWANSAVVYNAVNFNGLGGSLHTFCGLPNFIDSPTPDELPRDFTYANTSCSSVNFTVDPCWQPYTASWTFGDGTTGSGYSVNHTYATGGNYTVTLTLSYSTFSFPVIIKVVNVTAAPVTTISGPDTVCAGVPFPFNYSVPFATGAVYNWNTVIGIPVGATTGNTLAVLYPNTGIDTLHVTASNGACTTNATKIIYVVASPTANLTVNPNSCCVNNIVTLSGGSPTGGVYIINGSISNPVNASLLGLGTHLVTYQYTNAAGCYAQASDTLQVLACTGMGDAITNETLTIVPNPFEDKLEIVFYDVNVANATTISVYDVVGRELNQVSSINSKSLIINTARWSEGIYFISFKSTTGDTKTLKVLKSK
jgi:PKD repeat protein